MLVKFCIVSMLICATFTLPMRGKSNGKLQTIDLLPLLLQSLNVTPTFYSPLQYTPLVFPPQLGPQLQLQPQLPQNLADLLNYYKPNVNVPTNLNSLLLNPQLLALLQKNLTNLLPTAPTTPNPLLDLFTVRPTLQDQTQQLLNKLTPYFTVNDLISLSKILSSPKANDFLLTVNNLADQTLADPELKLRIMDFLTQLKSNGNAHFNYPLPIPLEFLSALRDLYPQYSS